MFRSKTLFILGAGSSFEVGLPIGEDLKKIIAKKIDIKFQDGYKQTSGDHQVMAAIRAHASKRVQRLEAHSDDVNPYLEKAWQLRDALPMAISIDNLLDAHKGDSLAEACGKFGIVRCILESEESSSLYCDHNKKINFSEITNTWFVEFGKVLMESVSRSDVNNIFQNVSFVNFNYDRCIEHYLFEAIQVYYGLDASSAVSIMKSLNIIRPYGSVGNLPWQEANKRVSVPYGFSNGNIFEISHGIKTFNEQLDDDENLQALRSLVQEAEIIVFLGFAFHRQNLELLHPRASCKAKRVYATALGISGSDCTIIQNEIVELLAQDETKASIEINRHKKCNELFKEYWRGLTAGV